MRFIRKPPFLQVYHKKISVSHQKNKLWQEAQKETSNAVMCAEKKRSFNRSIDFALDF
jgi:hypothetical protein